VRRKCFCDVRWIVDHRRVEVATGVGMQLTVGDVALTGQRAAGPASSLGLSGPADLDFSSVLLTTGRGWRFGDERSGSLPCGGSLEVRG
jgi:hypothetical protein